MQSGKQWFFRTKFFSFTVKMASLDKLKPDVAARLKLFEEIQSAKRQSQSIKNENVKQAAIKRKIQMEKMAASKTQYQKLIACDLLGDPMFRFHYSPSADPNDKKYNVKYARVSAQKIDDEKPLFFHSPPCVIIESSMEGLGNETFGKDLVLTRKFKVAAIVGMFKTQLVSNPHNPTEMVEVITNEIDPFPFISKWQADQHYLQNPFDREDDSKRKLQWEVQTFYDNIKRMINQADNFILSDDQFHEVFKTSNRWKAVDAHAVAEQSVWADKKRQIYLDDMEREGASDYPSIEASQWKMTSMGRAKFLKEQLNKLNQDMTLPIDWKMSENIQTLRTVLANSYVYDLKKTSAGMGKSHFALLERAYQMADEFIETTPNLLNRLATIKFQRPVWRAPPKATAAERETATNAAQTEYDKFKAIIKLENPNLTELEIKKMADEKILPYILEELKWTYNMPEITNFHGRPPQEKLHTSVLDKYLKPYSAISIGTVIMLTFMVNFSVPKAEMAYGVNFPIIGKIHQSFGAAVKHMPMTVARPIKSGMTTEDYESSFADFLSITEKMMNEKGSFDSNLFGEASPSFIQMAESSGLNEIPLNNHVLGEPQIDPPDYNEKDFLAQNANGEIEGGNPGPEKPKSKIINSKSKKRVPTATDVPVKNRRI